MKEPGFAVTADHDDENDVGPAAALLKALREDAVQDALNAIEADTGLARERIVAEAVIFAGRQRTAFLAQVRARQVRQRRSHRPASRVRRFLGENGVEVFVAGMFLLGAALAAIQIISSQ